MPCFVFTHKTSFGERIDLTWPRLILISIAVRYNQCDFISHSIQFAQIIPYWLFCPQSECLANDQTPSSNKLNWLHVGHQRITDFIIHVILDLMEAYVFDFSLKDPIDWVCQFKTKTQNCIIRLPEIQFHMLYNQTVNSFRALHPVNICCIWESYCGPSIDDFVHDSSVQPYWSCSLYRYNRIICCTHLTS